MMDCKQKTAPRTGRGRGQGQRSSGSGFVRRLITFGDIFMRVVVHVGVFSLMLFSVIRVSIVAFAIVGIALLVRWYLRKQKTR